MRKYRVNEPVTWRGDRPEKPGAVVEVQPEDYKLWDSLVQRGLASLEDVIQHPAPQAPAEKESPPAKSIRKRRKKVTPSGPE